MAAPNSGASSASAASSSPSPSTPRGPIDGVSFDTRLSLVDNIANLVAKEKQVLLMQLEEKTRALEQAQKQVRCSLLMDCTCIRTYAYTERKRLHFGY